MRRLIENVWAVLELARLAVITRFRLRGTYWKWRMHTAWGVGGPKSRFDLVRGALAYGRWVHEMRRGKH